MGLVLRRKVGESIIIDGVTEVKVSEVGYDWCRLWIAAPRNIIIDRKEVRDAKLRGEPKRTPAIQQQDGQEGAGSDDDHRSV